MKARLLLILCLFLSLSAMGQGIVQGTITRMCSTCGKARSECKYKGKHPTCSECKKIIGAKTNGCAYGGKHPTCARCRKLIGAKSNGCSYGGKHPAKPVVTTGTVNGHEWVDLGLPSGTKWATTNVGASSPSDNGNYYAWGETSTKGSYEWSNLKYCSSTTGVGFSKYVTSYHYGSVDDKKVLDPSDDAAYVNWGSGWRMPSFEQIKELKEKCKWTWTTVGGHNGYKVVGPNGNSLFLPAAGDRRGSSSDSVGSYGSYWSRTLSTGGGDDAYYLYFDSGYVDWSYYGYRRFGQSVRPVLAP